MLSLSWWKKDKRVYLWQTVDQNVQTINGISSKKRDSLAAKQFIPKVRKNIQQYANNRVGIHINSKDLDKRKYVNLNP